MISRLIAASLALAIPATAFATAPEAEPKTLPATVVVAFDSERVTPLIVEGVADRETGRVVEANDPVRIASISKFIMALATLRLFDEGKVRPDSDISEYLGYPVRSPHFPDAKVTLAQLLVHRSGLRDKAGYVIPLGESLQEKLADPDSWYPDAPPGEAPFEYANLGSPVVATVLEAATGERYDRLVERTVFAPLGVKACFNWIGCHEDQAKRAVVLYRHTGEVARDEPSDLPPNCTIPVAEGLPCSLDTYAPGTNASIFSPQGGLRIGLVDLAKIGQRLIQPQTGGFLSHDASGWWLGGFMGAMPEDQEFFCAISSGMQMIPAPGRDCLDDLFEDGRVRIGRAGEAYGLQSGLWFDPIGGDGFAYFLTQAPPPVAGEDTGGFTPGEKHLMKRAQERLAEIRSTQQSGD